jgi:E3 ubiquitin-protein ligase SHPRH
MPPPKPKEVSSDAEVTQEGKSPEAEALLLQIRPLKLNGSFGTKMDHIIRHILLIDKNESQAKSLVFSQWDQVLDIIATGLEKNGIKCVRLSGEGTKGSRKRKRFDAVKQFREDDSIKVFILNAKSQSSGLTLVRATHVFLVEPVVNLGLEMQGNAYILYRTRI